jgi:hypothetical protein
LRRDASGSVCARLLKDKVENWYDEEIATGWVLLIVARKIARPLKKTDTANTYKAIIKSYLVS